MNFRGLLDVLLHMLWPVSCPVCGRPAVIICDECIPSILEPSPITKTLNDLAIYSASFYHTEIHELIHAFKYKGVKLLCRPLGRAMGKLFVKPEIDYLLPVPLHLKSKRPYNQALELARGISEVWDLDILDGAVWSRVLPRRVGLSAKERMNLIRDAFIVSERVKGLRLAIVDDVCTTGTTLLRLSEKCTEAGAVIKSAYTLATVGS